MATKGNRPLDEVTEEREREAWLLRQAGWSQVRIADHLKVSQQAVSKMLNKTGRKLATDFKARAEVIKAEQTALLEHITDQAMQEWERSKQPIEKRSSKQQVLQGTSEKDADVDDEEEESKTISMPFGKAEVTLTTEFRLADPRYLSEARGAQGEIRKIWGAEAPQKTEVDTKHSGQVTLNSPTLQKAAEEISAWRQEQSEKLKQQRAERQAELALESQPEE